MSSKTKLDGFIASHSLCIFQDLESGPMSLTKFPKQIEANLPSNLRAMPWTRSVAAGTLLTSAILLVLGKRKAALAVAAAGGAVALIEDPDGPVRQRIVQFVEDLEIRMPTPEESAALDIAPGVPLARVFRVGHVASGEIVEVLDSRVPCDRHVFRYVIDVP